MIQISAHCYRWEKIWATDKRNTFRQIDSKTEKAIAYGILGGVPRYLEAFSSDISLEENIKNNLLMEGAFLNDKPQTLLRIELRELSVYNSILEAISNGCNKVCEIADRIHEEKSKCSKYMLTLQTLRLIEKCVPCTEPETSKKGISDSGCARKRGAAYNRRLVRKREVWTMKNPLHYQVSEYDCGPTSMLNAIIYLFNRDEIPPEVIRNTMLYCLDCYSKEGIPGKRGTSRAAV